MNPKMVDVWLNSAPGLRDALVRLRGNTHCLMVFCLLAAGALTSTACKSDYPAASAQQNPPGQETKEPRKVKTAQVAQRPMERTVTVIGALAAYDQATLSVKVPGRLSTITVDFASLVHKGDLIAQVEPRDYQLRVQQAEASLQQARARLGLPPDGTDDHVDQEQTGIVRQARALLEEARANRERSIKLLEETIISRARFDADDAAYKVAQSRYQDALEEVRNRQAILAQRRSELEIARQQLADTSLYAPFDGMIQERHASIGEYLAAGARIVTLVRMDPLRLRAEVPEREANDVRAGQTVRVTVEGDPNIYTGQVMRLSPIIAAQNRILMVEAEVKNNGSLRPGSFARVEIVTEEKNQALAVPTNAVLTFAGIEKVILVKDGKAVEKPVSLGRRTAEWTEVVSGVTVGDTVVVEPGNLQTGQPVNVQER
jgi:multidrug efflux pump subunit AcrA (membrane-fusion protein)